MIIMNPQSTYIRTVLQFKVKLSDIYIIFSNFQFPCERSVWQARWPALSSSGELLLEPHLLPILLYGTSAFKLPLSFAPSTLN